ncbi:transcription factor adf-1 [Plakobranchus ocellatus]|uniref:Transcription factor adf-1 n=1 Tax=Plakobranchus ocellatus TaxID=259542 RepID=A0AAV4B7L8_9GAST|nr:transcription factor adf-1 [Plakobranchus ocellatus]
MYTNIGCFKTLFSLLSTVENVRRRWQNLRGSFSKSLAAMKLPSGLAASPVPRFYLHSQMAFLTTHMGHAPVRGNYGSVVPAEELLDTEDEVGQGVTRPTILEESQCASSSSASSLSVSPPPSISPSPTPSHRSASARGKKRHHEEASAWEEAACDFFSNAPNAVCFATRLEQCQTTIAGASPHWPHGRCGLGLINIKPKAKLKPEIHCFTFDLV